MPGQETPKGPLLDPNNRLMHMMVELGIDHSYWAPFSLTQRQWLEAVEKYSWKDHPEFLGKDIYESKGGVYLMSPLVFGQSLSSQNVHGHYTEIRHPLKGQRKNIEEPVQKPPRDQVIIIGHQTGYEVLNTYLRLRDSEVRKQGEDGRFHTVRTARIDVVAPNRATIDSYVQREMHKSSIVHVYNHLDECAEKSPAFGNYDGVIAFERLSPELEHRLRR